MKKNIPSLLASLALAALLLTACGGPVVPEGTILPAKAGQQIWCAPGGPESPEGYCKELVTTLVSDEQLTVTADADGWYQGDVIGGDFAGTWFRVEATFTSVAGTQTLTGWINFSQMK